ncbi:hypothetical protein PWT90_05206 [Aphanocladium album]|nr:hypothetical protein PWT90_05206 [Aphanocladium album]
MDQDNTTGTSPFGFVHIIEPTSDHTHTAILLHGRGSGGEDFAEELAATPTSDGKSIFEKLPNWRWVFPTSPETWNATFEGNLCSWFDAYSLTDVSARQDLQTKGLLQSIEYVDHRVETEVKVLSGKRTASSAAHIGGFLAASTWLPFAKSIRKFITATKEDDTGQLEIDEADEYDEFIKLVLGKSEIDLLHGGRSTPYEAQGKKLPVFLSHGRDDAYVDVSLGREARDVTIAAGFEVVWKEFEGAEQEGHWLQSPNQMDDICNFIATLEQRIEQLI